MPGVERRPRGSRTQLRCDTDRDATHAHNTTAATMGPTPGCSSRSGRQALMSTLIACSWRFASVRSAWHRRAKSRNTPTYVRVSRSQRALTRRRVTVVSMTVVERASESGPQRLGCGDDQCVELVLHDRGTVHRGPSRRKQHGQRHAWTRGARVD